MVLALCAEKFHLFLLLPVFLAGRRLWTGMWGMLAGGTILVALSFAAGGPHWFADFLRVTLDARINPHPWAMPNLHGMLYGTNFINAAEAALSLCVCALVWCIARSRVSTEYALAAAAIGGLLTSHHAYLPDAALLLPAALTFPFEAAARWVRMLAVAAVLPTTWFLTAIPALMPVPPLLILVLLAGAGVSVSGKYSRLALRRRIEKPLAHRPALHRFTDPSGSS
jgi:hypothetical protein